MKIKLIRASNILSFAHVHELDEATQIIFDASGIEGNLHILIGPNGSGKSNFIEILNQVFKNLLFIPVLLDENKLLENRKSPVAPENLRQTLTFEPQQPPSHLEKNRDSDSLLRIIDLILDLNEDDLANLRLLIENRSKINDVLERFSTTGISVSDGTNPEQLQHHKELKLQFQADQHSRTFSISYIFNDSTPETELIKQYLINFDLFRKVVYIHNKYLTSNGEASWPQLKETFALLGSYRNYNAFSGLASIETNMDRQRSITGNLRNESTKAGDGNEPAVFWIVKNKLVNSFYELYQHGSSEQTVERLKHEEPYSSIAKLIKEYLDLELKVEQSDPTRRMDIELHLQDNRGSRIDPYQLSSGEKGILHFIFSLYGYDLHNGVMIIDEPELHLHPQMQKKYLQVIKEIKKKFNLQFIVATHSPVFIDQDTIKDVYRFYKENSATRIIKPASIETEQKQLIQILNYTNSAKIFFVNKVILVEGVTDEYFYRFFLDWLRENADATVIPWKSNIEDYEILNVGGKGAFEKWKSFLECFGLNVYSIADLDKIDRTKSGTVLKGIKETDPIEWSEIQARIVAKYAENLFILKEGDLEDYLGIDKGLEYVIEFCQGEFVSWKDDPDFRVFKDELIEILGSVFR